MSHAETRGFTDTGVVMVKLLRRKDLLTAMVAVPAAFFLYGYTIAPGDNIHERMTMASKRCFDLAAAGGAKPTACELNIAATLAAPDLTWIASTYKLPKLDDGVKWPDDPSQQFSLLTGLKALTRMNKCKSRAEKAGVTPINVNAGLLCNSNVGTMQFFHAQATASGEPALYTWDKIMQWSEFLYGIATDPSNAKLDQQYCDRFSANKQFERAMLYDPTSKPCGKNGRPGWTVKTLLTQKCHNILSWQKCGEEKGPASYDIARINATGALLHLIQDAYSQSHCVRGQCEVATGKVVAKVECTPIRMYTTYVGQVNHADADRDPLWSESCRAQTDANTTDPITAGARVLWDIRNNAPLAVFKADMELVFGSGYASTQMVAAEVGDCFQKAAVVTK